MKDPVQVQSPGRNCLLVILRVEKPRHRVSLALFDSLPLDLGHSPVIEDGLGGDSKYMRAI